MCGKPLSKRELAEDRRVAPEVPSGFGHCRNQGFRDAGKSVPEASCCASIGLLLLQRLDIVDQVSHSLLNLSLLALADARK